MKTWIRRLFATRPRTIRTARRPRLRVEVLGDRVLPAATAVLSGGALLIAADPAGSGVTVTRSGGTFPTLVVQDDGQHVGTFSALLANRVTFAGGAGDDTFAYANDVGLPLTATGGAGQDQLTGGSAGDSLDGGNANDTLQGGGGNDALTGGPGSDVFAFDADASLGSDTVTEAVNGGTDVLDFSTSTAGVAVHLGTTGTQRINGNLFLTLSAASVIENVVGGAGNDQLTGNALANRLEGNGGNDTLLGGLGNDTYTYAADAPLGADRVVEFAGEGTDTLDFSAGSARVAVALGVAGSQAVNANLSLTLSDGGVIENVFGSAGDDHLTGNALANILAGGAGNDIYGFDADTPQGADTVADSTGVEKLDFQATTAGVAVDLQVAATQAVNAHLSLTLSGIEDVTGGAGNDTLSGTTGSNILTGGDGDDTLIGRGGNDTLTGSAGDDTYRFTTFGPQVVTIVEAGGIDTLDFAAATTPLSVNLNVASSVQSVTPQLSLTVFPNAIEHVIGGSANDTLTGNDAANRLDGGGGDDRFEGRGGNDTLTGGGGDDRYLFDADSPLGADTIVEGAGGGTDTLDFANTENAALTVDLAVTGPQTVTGTLTLVMSGEVENIVGGRPRDILRGNGLANRLDGGAGDDFLEGRGGDDTLTGGSGNDTFAFDTDGPLGTDVVQENRPDGIDRLDFSAGTAGVVVLLGVEGIQTVSPNLTLALSDGLAFENATGGAGDDVLVGNDLGNLLEGRGGNDVLQGGQGDDAYRFDTDGALGTDRVAEVAGGGNDLLDFGTSTAGVTIDLAATDAQAVNANLSLTLSGGDVIERATGGAGGSTLRGNGLANVLTGGNAGNVLEGRGGDDTLLGGGGNDIYAFDADAPLGADRILEAGGTDVLDFTATEAGVAVDLGRSDVQTVNANLSLQLPPTPFAFPSPPTTLEVVRGGSGNDVLRGNATANRLDGGPGDDTLAGGTGDDTYTFTGGGADTVDEAVNGGTDTLDLSTAAAAVRLNLADAGLQQVADGVALTLAQSGGALSAVENVRTGAGNDVLIGNALNNRLDGGAGDDTYAFNADAPGGSDTVVEAAGGGTDTVDLSAGTAPVNVNLATAEAQSVNAKLSLILGAGGIENVTGGSGGDALIGDAGANRLDGGAGDDVLQGGPGDDTLLGGDGNDIMIDGEGANTIDGGAGQDGVAFTGTAGNDRIRVRRQVGPAGAQVVVEMNGRTFVMNYKNGETVFVHAGGGNDEVVMDDTAGAFWRAEFFGEGGHDRLVGGARNDRLDGGAGHDWLEGAAGDDDLIGGAGHDLFDGGAGADRIAAGDAEVDLIFVDSLDVIDVRDPFDVIVRRPRW